MKKYITAVLIPCLLLQLAGCSSTKYIQADEIDSYRRYSDLVMELADGRKVIIKNNVSLAEVRKDTNTIFCEQVKFNGKDVSIYRKMFSENIEKAEIDIDTLIIKTEDLKSIQTQEFNDNTGFFLVAVAVIVGVIIFIVDGFFGAFGIE